MQDVASLCSRPQKCHLYASIPSVLINEEMSRSIFIRQHARLFLSTHTWQLLLFRMCTVATLAAGMALATQLVQRIGFRNVYAPIVTSLSGRTDIHKRQTMFPAKYKQLLLQSKSDAWLQSMMEHFSGSACEWLCTLFKSRQGELVRRACMKTGQPAYLFVCVRNFVFRMSFVCSISAPNFLAGNRRSLILCS